MLWEQGDIDEEVILGLILTCVMTRKYLPEFTTQKNSGIDQFFFGGRGGGERFGIKLVQTLPIGYDFRRN